MNSQPKKPQQWRKSVRGASPGRLWMALVISAALVTPACSPKRAAHQHTATLKLQYRGTDDEMGPSAWSKLQELFDLYAVEGRLSKSQIATLLEHFSPKMNALVAQAAESETTADYSFKEFSDMLESKCATLAWLKLGSLQDEASRISTLQRAYPKAHAPLLDELSRLLGANDSNKLAIDDIFKLGVYLSQAQQLFKKQAAQPLSQILLQKLFTKTLWAIAPDIPVAADTGDDHEISQLIFALNFRSASKPGPLQKPSPDDASTSNLSANAAKDPSSERARHRLYFHSILAKSGFVDQELAVEEVDWTMNLTLDKIIQASSHDLLAQHMAQTYPLLLANWNASSPFFNFASAASIMDDLLLATLTDDLMQSCQLTPAQPLDKDFVEIFAYRVENEKAAIDSTCVDIEKIFHPDAVTYAIWKLKAEFRRIAP